jgi:hypothetical protein
MATLFPSIHEQEMSDTVLRLAAPSQDAGAGVLLSAYARGMAHPAKLETDGIDRTSQIAKIVRACIYGA